MSPKQKVTLYLMIFFIAAGSLIGYSYYAESSKTFDFDEFTIEAPALCEFKNITPDDSEFTNSYRSTNIDLTVTSFDKSYLENTYLSNTGDKIDFGKSALENLNGFHNPKIVKGSENITFYIINTRVNGQIDTDVAGIYNDDNHFIIVEGGDVEFIEEITNSIKINDS